MNTLLMIIFIAGPLWLFWVILSPLWYGQKRWVVRYPPEDSLRITGEYRADWSEPMTYYTAKNYATIFNGEVYRVR